MGGHLMYDFRMRWAAFAAVALALLNSGYHFRLGDPVATLYFMTAAIAVTILSHLCVRRCVI